MVVHFDDDVSKVCKIIESRTFKSDRGGPRSTSPRARRTYVPLCLRYFLNNVKSTTHVASAERRKVQHELFQRDM